MSNADIQALTRVFALLDAWKNDAERDSQDQR